MDGPRHDRGHSAASIEGRTHGTDRVPARRRGRRGRRLDDCDTARAGGSGVAGRVVRAVARGMRERRGHRQLLPHDSADRRRGRPVPAEQRFEVQRSDGDAAVGGYGRRPDRRRLSAAARGRLRRLGQRAIGTGDHAGPLLRRRFRHGDQSDRPADRHGYRTAADLRRRRPAVRRSQQPRRHLEQPGVQPGCAQTRRRAPRKDQPGPRNHRRGRQFRARVDKPDRRRPIQQLHRTVAPGRSISRGRSAARSSSSGPGAARPGAARRSPARRSPACWSSAERRSARGSAARRRVCRSPVRRRAGSAVRRRAWGSAVRRGARSGPACRRACGCPACRRAWRCSARCCARRCPAHARARGISAWGSGVRCEFFCAARAVRIPASTTAIRSPPRSLGRRSSSRSSSAPPPMRSIRRPSGRCRRRR